LNRRSEQRVASRPDRREHTVIAAERGACVIPLPQCDIDKVTSRLPGPAEALLRLSSYPRSLGWTDTVTMVTSFQSLADLVERIPVFEAQILWGLPFAGVVLRSWLP
jgi:hypothetical protein